MADRMGVSPLVILGVDELPAWVAQDYLLVMEAEAEARRREETEWRRQSWRS